MTSHLGGVVVRAVAYNPMRPVAGRQVAKAGSCLNSDMWRPQPGNSGRLGYHFIYIRKYPIVISGLLVTTIGFAPANPALAHPTERPMSYLDKLYIEPR
jgi:hypothetical protein